MVWLRNVIVMGFVALAGPAVAQSSEIEAVISDQMADFLADDFAGAFEHASPMIRGLFGTADNFGTMVRGQYPMVHRPRDFRFLDLAPAPPEMHQMVEVMDANGLRHLLRYDMVETEEGWKINGVTPVPAPDVAA